MKDSLFISVIIPVLNDTKRLELCLRALEQQTYPKDLYEVIVVDNGSVENTEALVKQFTQAAFTQEFQPGSYAARNQGISLAKGEVIAFTDSDCIPAPNWLESGLQQLVSVPNCGLVGGRIAIFFQNPSHPTAIELYDSINYLQQQKYIETYKYGATANLFTFKQVLAEVGLFNSQLKSGGDREWGNRVAALGYSLVYANDSCVAHPARHSLAQLYQKVSRVKQGYRDLKRINNRDANYSLNQLKQDLFSLKPPLRTTIHKVWTDQRLRSNKQKLQVFFVTLLAHYLETWEKMRSPLENGSNS